jgi:hypothetical protein
METDSCRGKILLWAGHDGHYSLLSHRLARAVRKGEVENRAAIAKNGEVRLDDRAQCQHNTSLDKSVGTYRINALNLISK